MSKKFTSFLVLAAAVLLAIPAQAQTARKASKAQVLTSRVAKIDKQAAQKAKSAQLKAQEATIQGIAFRGQAVQQNNVSKEEEQAMKAADKTIGTPIGKWDWAAHQTPQFVPQTKLVAKGILAQEHKTNIRLNAFDGQKPEGVRGPNRAATVNANGIITAPDEGEEKYYTRAGTAFYVASNSVYSEDQSGIVTIVEAEGGKVYIKDPVSHYSQGSWVEGTKDGNTITVAAGQPLAWNSNYSTTLGLYWANVQSTSTGNTYIKDEAGSTITFTVDDEAGTITLDGSSTDKIIAVFWDDDNSWSGYGDYGTVWTLNTEYEPASTDLIVLPDGAEVQNWYADGTGSAAVPTDVMVAFVGNEVYISGLTSNFPDAWIKGTLDGTTVTFSKFQFVGMYSGTMPIWAVGADSETGNLQDFTMTYDSEAQTLALDANQLLVFNAAEDRMYYLSYIESLTIYAEKPAPAQIDELPYINSFDDAADQKHFTIIDANEDGRTWNWYSGMARYTYSSTNQGDDWLVSPAIKLVAGKKYAFSIAAHAQSASYPERIEVKAAQENTAEALAAGTEVLPSTDVTTPGFVTYENNEFTVAESGYYYIGVHAISDADEYYLYVDDFLIEAAPIAAPYSADLTQAGTIDDFFVIDNNGDNSTWSWSASNGAYYTYNSTNAADDYLVLPIILENGKNYNIVVTASAAGTSFPEKFEVKVGKTATVEGLNITAIAETTVATTDDTEYEGIFTPEEAGTYYVAIHAISDPDMWCLNVKKLVVEAGAESDAPAAVDNFAVAALDGELGATISFTAPTKNIAGEELAADAITKIDILRNGAVIKTIEAPAPGAELTYVDQDEALTIGTYKYQAITYGASGIGGKSEEISVFLSAILTVPYTADFTVAGTIDAFQVIDNNDDSSTWGWSASYNAYYSYNTTNQADDYLVSSPIRLEAGKNYKVTVNAKSYSASYPERFEVVVGKAATAEALNITAIAATDVASDDAEDYEGDFTAPEAGEYYVAIHAISDPDMWRLQVSSLSIEKGLEPTAPAAPEISAVAGAEGALTAAITVVAPNKSIDGNTLTADNLTKVEILRDGEVIATETPAPGATINITDNEVTTGNHTYQAIPYDANGDAGKKSEKVTIYVGEDELADVENVVATATASTITFTWDAATGLNGGYVNSANIEYSVVALEIEQGFFGNYLVEGETLATVTAATTATINYDTNSGDQTYLYFGVKATNAAGSTDATTNYTYVLVGAPDELPIEEGFAGSTLHYNWDSNGGLGISNNSSDDDGVALKLYNDGTSPNVYFYLPKVNLATAANPTLLFDVRSEAVNQVYAIGAADGASLDIIGSAHAVSAEYTTVKVPLSSIKGQDYSAVGILANIPTESVSQYEDTLIIDNIKIVDLYEYDLSINVSAPKTVQAGQTATITATVKNEGENAAEDYKVTIKAGNDVLLEQTVSEALGAFKTKAFTAELATTIFDNAADVTISAEVSYEIDLNEDNNAAETLISIKESSAAQPENFTAQNGANGVDLSWTAPSTTASEVTEDFASYENGADEDGELGDWTLINANGYTKGGIFEDTSLASDGLVRAWQVFNLATYGGDNSTFAGPDGNVDNNYLISVYNLQDDGYPGNDDYLISPELPGIAQTLTFSVKAFNDYGAQTYQVLYSTTDNQIESFQLIEEVSDNGNAWNTVTYQLPAGTKYFAIRNITGGDEGFILAVDDINFLIGGGSVASYNIYVESDKIASVEGDKTTYTIAADKITAGEHTFALTAVYANGAESKPVTATLSVVTSIEQIVAAGQAVDVYSLDGKLVRQQTNSLSGLKGVYVINGKAVIVK